MNLAQIIDGHPDDKVALVHHARRITYGELRSMVAQARGDIAKLGMNKGDRVGIVAAATPRFVVSYLAMVGSGLVAVPMNPRSPAAELEKQIAAVEPRALVVGPVGAKVVGELSDDVRSTIEFVAVPPDVELTGSICLDASGTDPVPVMEMGDDDLAGLMFTSGTAGFPKPAMLTHSQLLANLEQMAAAPNPLLADDVVLCPIPLFHIHGLNALMGPTLQIGATMVLMERFDPTTAIDMVKTEGLTAISGPPTLWAALAATDAASDALDRIRICLSGGAALAPETRKAFHARYGIWIIEGYGLTESGGVLTVGTPEMPSGSIGVPVPGVAMRLVDKDGDDVLIGDEGEIWAKGPNIFPGYWQDPEATANAVDEDGWLHTGDIAVIGEDGLLRIVDRAKDLIVVSGFNVFPAEVEEVLRTHAGVKDAAVIGVAHPHHGEAVKAYVVANEGTHLEVDALVDHCRNYLAGYKCPVALDIVEEIPRTASGKVKRRELRPA